MEILTVENVGDVVAALTQLLQIFALFGVVDGSEGDVMDGTGPETAAGLARAVENVDI